MKRQPGRYSMNNTSRIQPPWIMRAPELGSVGCRLSILYTFHLRGQMCVRPLYCVLCRAANEPSAKFSQSQRRSLHMLTNTPVPNDLLRQRLNITSTYCGLTPVQHSVKVLQWVLSARRRPEYRIWALSVIVKTFPMVRLQLQSSVLCPPCCRSSGPTQTLPARRGWEPAGLGWGAENIIIIIITLSLSAPPSTSRRGRWLPSRSWRW